MLKLSRNLLDNMDRFVIDRAGQTRHRRETVPPRRQPNSESNEYEFAEVGRN